MPAEGIYILESGIVPPPDDLWMRAGGKAHGLLKLAALGFPVPPGFVLPTTLGRDWLASVKPSLAEFKSAYAGVLERMERVCRHRFGDLRRPLLVSVRSSPPVSMPGMLNTVLNVGLTQSNIPGFIALTGNPRLAWDCYRFLIESYAQSVLDLDLHPFDAATAAVLSAAKAQSVAELDTITLRELVLQHLKLFSEITGEQFPEDPYAQLLGAIDSVFRSWNCERAKAYRRISGLSDASGTAVMVQCMVFGNAGGRSGAGVGFTRDPASGDKHLYLDFAFDAQGEDVVAGRKPVSTGQELRSAFPDIVAALDGIAARLEGAFRYPQDFEFTVSDGKIYLLQTRDAKCSDWARLKIAVDLVEEGVIGPEEALRRLEGLNSEKLVRRRLAATGTVLASGVSASVGVASGPIALSLEEVKAFEEEGQGAILVRSDIRTEDVEGIATAAGVLTAKGGRTSHAAVIARELGKVAIVGCRNLQIAEDGSSCIIGGHVLKPGATVTLDGET
ncbi:MAG: pyruvate, phosphate dikinase, partial [Alphaproteobacteria bacterium]|nr:pyruvate, phosphate dikinase [Alphaproteobacteria bacterium]